MRILIATSDYPPALGGMAEYSAAWAEGLRAEGDDVAVLARDLVAADAARQSRIEAERVAWPQGPLRDPWNAWRRLKRAIERGAPDLVMAHTWIGWGPALAWLKGRAGIPYILAAHGAEVLGPMKSRFYRAFMRESFRGADSIFAVSSFTADYVAALGLSRQRIEVIGNGVDVARFRPSPRPEALVRKFGLENRRVLLTVGGLVERKGHDTVIEALALLKDRFPDLSYLIAGGWAMNSSREGFLRELVAQRGLDDRVVFTGFVAGEELPELYRLADLFVMTGREVKDKGWVEGFGISYLEAAASGLPIVAADTGGVREAVSQSNAILVRPDDPAGTAEAIARMLDDAALRSSMGAASRAWAEQNTWNRKIRMGSVIMRRIIAG